MSSAVSQGSLMASSSCAGGLAAEDENVYCIVKSGKTLAQLLLDTQTALDSLESSQKRDYETATSVVPQLVESETPLIIFLRTEQYNPQKAAERLALYWKYRKEIFGERWLFPLVQTGRGALTPEDVAFLRSGWTQSYACGPDEHMIVQDWSKLIDVCALAQERGYDILNMHDRCCMYILTVNTGFFWQTKGVTIVQIVNSKARPVGFDFRRDMWDCARYAIPFKLRRAIILEACEYGKEKLLEFNGFRAAKLVEYGARIPTEHVHEDSVAMVMRKLESRGVNREFVPVSVGGALCLNSKFLEWTRARLSIEEITSASPTSFDVASKPSFSTGTGTSVAGPVVNCRRNESETKEDFHRKRNALYSRRIYHKRKLICSSLEDEVRKWEDLNAKLRRENQRLELLLAQARLLVGSSAHSIFAASNPYQNMLAVYNPHYNFFAPCNL